MVRLKPCLWIAVCAIVLLGVLPAKAQSTLVAVSSPDQRITLHFAVIPGTGQDASEGQLVYSVTFRGKPVLENSGLSLQLESQPPLGTAVHIAGSTHGSGVDDYVLIGGKASHVHDSYNEVTVQAAEGASPGRRFAVEAHVYNDAVAFRYEVPMQAALTRYQLTQENTEFRFSDDATAWAIRLPNYTTSYESEYIRQTISALNNGGDAHSRILVGAPMLLHLPGVAWAAICDADIEGNSAMYLEAVPGDWENHSLVTKVSPPLDGHGPAVDASLPHHSAWRVLLLGDKPGALIESNVISDLNPPNRVADTSWIHPGKASWDWWSGDLDPDGKPAFTTKNMEYYVDFAAESGFPYMMLDAGWSGRDITRLRGNVDVPELVRYAAKKKV
ncbi:MAG: glycoside hydrolase family 97 N-terminal domain-containing protein, partial [Acidobacteriaceae bacterium]